MVCDEESSGRAFTAVPTSAYSPEVDVPERTTIAPKGGLVLEVATTADTKARIRTARDTSGRNMLPRMSEYVARTSHHSSLYTETRRRKEENNMTLPRELVGRKRMMWWRFIRVHVVQPGPQEAHILCLIC